MDDDPAVKAGIFIYETHPCFSFPGDKLPWLLVLYFSTFFSQLRFYGFCQQLTTACFSIFKPVKTHP